jgi:hypothetical protein
VTIAAWPVRSMCMADPSLGILPAQRAPEQVSPHGDQPHPIRADLHQGTDFVATLTPRHALWVLRRYEDRT